MGDYNSSGDDGGNGGDGHDGFDGVELMCISNGLSFDKRGTLMMMDQVLVVVLVVMVVVVVVMEVMIVLVTMARSGDWLSFAATERK